MTDADTSRRVSAWASRALSFAPTHVLLGLVILALDLATGPFLQFPILFVVPVSLCAWYCSVRWAYGLAVLLPVGRLLISSQVEKSQALPYALANAATRVAVLFFLAYLVARTSRQTAALAKRVEGFVTMCAWSRTIEHEGEWISFEEYLRRRFHLETTHGVSPEQRRKVMEALEAARREE